MSSVETLEEEVQRLRAIVEGREVPPTKAECVAHAAAGGRWCVTHDHCGKEVSYVLRAGATSVDEWMGRTKPVRWIPMRDGKPVEWPVAQKKA